MALICTTAFGTIGDTWSLSGDWPAYAAGGITPVALGSPDFGQWELLNGWGNSYDNAALDHFTSELPSQNNGQANPAQPWLCMVKMNTDDGPTTTYGIGEVGGHANIGAIWYAPEDGYYQLTALGYNARTADFDRDLELQVNGTQNGGAWIGMVPTFIDNDLNKGLANAASYTTGVIQMQAGDIFVTEVVGEDWCGMDMTVTQVIPEPATMLLLGLGSLLAIRRRK